jgi:hypothetical protein
MALPAYGENPSIDADKLTVRFTVNRSYAVRSMNDYDSFFRVTIKARTAKTVTTERGTHRIKVRDNWGDAGEACETIKPWGDYSMCPIISANKEA